MPLMPAPTTHPVQEWLTQNGKTIEASLQEADSKIRLLMRQVSSWQDWSDELKAFQALNAQGSLVPTPRSVEDEDEDSWGAWGPQGLGTASVTRARNDPPANVAIPLKEAGPRLENLGELSYALVGQQPLLYMWLARHLPTSSAGQQVMGAVEMLANKERYPRDQEVMKKLHLEHRTFLHDHRYVVLEVQQYYGSLTCKTFKKPSVNSPGFQLKNGDIVWAFEEWERDNDATRLGYAETQPGMWIKVSPHDGVHAGETGFVRPWDLRLVGIGPLRTPDAYVGHDEHTEGQEFLLGFCKRQYSTESIVAAEDALAMPASDVQDLNSAPRSFLYWGKPSSSRSPHSNARFWDPNCRGRVSYISSRTCSRPWRKSSVIATSPHGTRFDTDLSKSAHPFNEFLRSRFVHDGRSLLSLFHGQPSPTQQEAHSLEHRGSTVWTYVSAKVQNYHDVPADEQVIYHATYMELVHSILNHGIAVDRHGDSLVMATSIASLVAISTDL